MNVPRVYYCLFCDDIRHEVGGKRSLIGIYQNDMIFNSPPPVVYPKLCGHLIIISEPDDIPEFVKVTIYDPEGKESVQFEAKFESTPEIPEGSNKCVLNIGFQTPEISFSKEGWIEVWVETEHGKERAGRLFVSFKDPQVVDEKENS